MRVGPLGMEGLPAPGGHPVRAGLREAEGLQAMEGHPTQAGLPVAARLRVRGSRPPAADRGPGLLPMAAAALPVAVDPAAIRGPVRAAAARGQVVVHPVKEAAVRGAAIGPATAGLHDRAA